MRDKEPGKVETTGRPGSSYYNERAIFNTQLVAADTAAAFKEVLQMAVRQLIALAEY